MIDCRRVLKYTYALGYFLADNSPEKHLFEHHQEMLEKNTERLHEFTEMPLDMIDRTQVYIISFLLFFYVFILLYPYLYMV